MALSCLGCGITGNRGAYVSCRTQSRRAWSGNRQLDDGMSGTPVSQSTAACAVAVGQLGGGGGQECAAAPNSWTVREYVIDEPLEGVLTS